MKQIITIVVLLASLFFSCGDGKVSETETEQEAASSKTSDTIFYAEDDDTIKFKFEYTLANMPSPASAIQELKLYGVPYSKQLLNETTKIPGYPDEFKLALNMGVYAIDMTYAMSNRFGSDVVDYSRGIMMLAQRLDLNKAINLLIGKRAENNMNNRDSIFKIIDEILIKSDSYLKTNKRILTATAIYTGSWIETNYLHCAIYPSIKSEAVKKIARKKIWEQDQHLANLIDLLNDFEYSQELKNTIEDLSKIHELIKSTKTSDELTDEKFAEITIKVNELRNRTVN